MLYPFSPGTTLKNLKPHVNAVLVSVLNLILWLKVNVFLLSTLNSELDEHW